MLAEPVPTTGTWRPLSLRRIRRALPVVVVLSAVIALMGAWPRESSTTTYRTAQVARADLRATVTATGTLDAVQSVEVGTQVSGVIQELLVDFNDPVRAGQVIARIDPTLLEADVRAAEANLSLRRAEQERAAAELARTERLDAGGAATRQELEVARSAAAAASAQLQSAHIALERARRNREYAVITSPIDGTVVVRDVEVGQTVNAGMSAPRLFVVAGDLSRMQMLATVDEADIGRVAEGQPVSFTVQAWPGERFEGTVRQVRLQSTEAENIVTYTVVVDVNNPDGRLLPGMTATVDFIVDQAPDAIAVPNAALRFRPDDAPPSHRPTVHVLRDGEAVPVPVEVGLTDGRNTAVLAGLEPGDVVITGVQAAHAAPAPTNPFQAQSSGRRRGGF